MWFKQILSHISRGKKIVNINTFVQEHIVGMNLVQILTENSEFED